MTNIQKRKAAAARRARRMAQAAWEAMPLRDRLIRRNMQNGHTEADAIAMADAFVAATRAARP